MHTDTIAALKAAHSQMAALLGSLETQLETQAPALQTSIVIDSVEISLKPGEHYAGLVLDAEGKPGHHLVLLPDQAEDVSWPDAMAWAEKIGGALPTRQEQALLYANLKGKFEAAWYWSSESHESNGSCAWSQAFLNGNPYGRHKSYEGRARAVRRFAA